MENTKQKTQKTLSLFLGLVLVLSSLPSLILAANFDTSYYPVLQASNYTQYPGCRDWARSVSAQSGETVSFLIYYYNTSNETAKNVRVRLIFSNQKNTTQIATGHVLADNASTVVGSVTINLNEAQILTLLSGNVFWYPNGSSGTALPNSQSGNEIVTPAGLNLGDLGSQTAGYVVARARVSNYKAPEIISQNFTPSFYEDEMTLKAQINPNGADTEVWFEWGTTSNNLTEKTFVRTILGGNTGSIEETIYKLLPETTYYFRTAAKNEISTVYGQTLNFTTLSSRKPEVKTFAASDRTHNSAVLWLEVSPHGLNTAAYFEWGTSFSSLNSQTPSSSYAGETIKSSSYRLTNLHPETIYYFRAVASNVRGKVYGETKSFTTASQTQSQSQPQSQPQSQSQTQPQPQSQTQPQPSPSSKTQTKTPPSQPTQTKIVYVPSSVPASRPISQPAARTCNCSEWQKAGCAEGACQGFERLEKRTCNPEGCEIELRCVPDASCSKISKTMFLKTEAPDEAQASETINLRINYRNDTSALANKVNLRIFLPEQAIFEKYTSSRQAEGQINSSLTSKVENLILALGDLAQDEEGEIILKIKIDEKTSQGEVVEIPVELSYNFPQITVFSTERIKVKEKPIGLAGALGGLFKFGVPLWLIGLILIVVVAALIYLRRFKEKKHQPERPKTETLKPIDLTPKTNNYH